MNRYICRDLYFNSVNHLVYLWEQKYKRILKDLGQLNQYGNFVLNYNVFVEKYLEFEFDLVRYHNHNWIKCIEILIKTPEDTFLPLLRYFTTELRWLDSLDRKIAGDYLKSIADNNKN